MEPNQLRGLYPPRRGPQTGRFSAPWASEIRSGTTPLTTPSRPGRRCRGTTRTARRERLKPLSGRPWNTLAVAAESKAVERAADELYGLPPAEFTRARDERAKQLRKEGDRKAADAVKALRKPTVAASAVNRLSRTRRKEVDRLLAAGEELQAAQADLLAGGDRSAFQRAAATERELVSGLAAEAGPGLEEKVAATLHAAALDAEVADELRAGRLVREREAVGGFGVAGAAEQAPARKQKRRPKPAARPRPSGRAKEKSDAGAKRERLAAARTDERHARRELDAATKALDHAETRAEAAEAHAAEAAERAKATAERLREAKRAQAAARKAHTRAERALAGAE